MTVPAKNLQCKDIPVLPILRFLESLGDRSGCIYPLRNPDQSYVTNSVWNALPPDTPEKLARAKLGGLLRRKLISGCICGCRGDFDLTSKGRIFLAQAQPPL